LRVVFDSNILIAALVFPGGRGEAALVRILNERDELILSKAILDETLSVLARKFARDTEELARIAVYLSGLSTSVKPRRQLEVLKDAPDNRVLECAVAGRAAAIVTGDKAMLALGEYNGIQILSLSNYLNG
jgi:putative PIN family toxin of toxin-antitoxin system